MGGLVKCVHVLLLGLLFDSDDLCKILSSSLLFFAFGPLLANLGKLLLVVFQVGRLIVPLAILFTHVSIIRLQSLRILFISAIVLRQQLLFLLLVSIFSLFQLLCEIFDVSLQSIHIGLMVLFLRILECLSSHSEVGLVLELFLSQVLSGFFEIFNLDTSMFFCLLAFFYVLLEVLFFNFQLL